MNKLTVFTVVLSILVVVVVSEVLFNNYLGAAEEGTADVLTTQDSPKTGVHPSLSKSQEANVSNSDSNGEVSLSAEELQKLIETTDIESGYTTTDNTNTTEDPDIEILSISETGISDESLKLAKFPDASLVTANFDDKLFQTIDVSDMAIEIKKEYVANNQEVFGAIYTFSVDEGMQNELYRVLRERAAFGKSIEINETNTFGDNSFYMNDSQRESTAFVVIRKGRNFYALAYPKKFNQYFKPLAQSL